MHAKAGESDRAIRVKMVSRPYTPDRPFSAVLILVLFYQPKHLFAGKRKMGKTDRR